MTEIVLYSLLIMVASLIGVVSVWYKVGRIIEKNLGFLVSFSAGVFLVITYQLSVETLEHSSNILFGFFWIALGAFIVWGSFKFIPLFHHHHDHDEKCEHNPKIDARRVLLGDGIHNIGDGILLTAAFVVNPALGALTAISIFIHELVQETSEFFILRQAGYSVKKALIINFMISGTILVGSVGSYFLLGIFNSLEAPLLGIAAGSFLVVVAHDLIPHSIRESDTKTHYIKHTAWFVVGFALMLLINVVTVHSHDHDHQDHDYHEHIEYNSDHSHHNDHDHDH